MLREDLDAAIELPARDEWRPERRAAPRWRARSDYALIGLVALALIAVAIGIGSQLAAHRGEQQRAPTTTPVPSAAPTPNTGLLTGTVISAATGLPIPGVYVQLIEDVSTCEWASDQLTRARTCRWYYDTAYTDDSGNYRLLVTNGRYKVLFFVPLSGDTSLGAPPVLSTVAYLSQWWSGNSDFQTAHVLVIAGQDVGGVDASLAAAHKISGRVLSPLGRGLPTVIEVARVTPAGCCSWVSGAGTNNGEYALPVPNGIYRIRFRGPPTGTAADPGYRYKWWPDGLEFSDAQDIVVQDGDVDGVDIVLPYDR